MVTEMGAPPRRISRGYSTASISGRGDEASWSTVRTGVIRVSLVITAEKKARPSATSRWPGLPVQMQMPGLLLSLAKSGEADGTVEFGRHRNTFGCHQH